MIGKDNTKQHIYVVKEKMRLEEIQSFLTIGHEDKPGSGGDFHPFYSIGP